MLFTVPPMLKGDYTAQMRQMHSYLFKQSQELNAALSSVSTEKQLAYISEALTAASDTNPAKASKDLRKFQELKSLVIKTASEVVTEGEEFRKTLSGYYVASGDFGKYMENASVVIEGTPVGITQLYSYSAGVVSDYSDMEYKKDVYIKTGLLYYNDDGEPVYGVGVGNIATKLRSDGKLTLNRENVVATYTSDQIAFWQGNTRVAYISAKALHVPSADITGGTLNIGNGTFKVDSNGKIWASAGVIGGCTIDPKKGLQVGAANITSIDASTITTGILKADRIEAGTITADKIVSLNPEKITTGDISSGTTINFTLATTRFATGSYMMSGVQFGSGDDYALIDGNMLRATNTGGSYSYGALWTSIAQAAIHWSDNISDARHKTDVAALDERHDILFDNLTPRQFKYLPNERLAIGNSGRTHTGFVAQEVLDAMSEAGLSDKDFAAYVLIDNLIEGEQTYSLRKEEFIAINTWQIQKLKSRMAELERKVAMLNG